MGYTRQELAIYAKHPPLKGRIPLQTLSCVSHIWTEAYWTKSVNKTHKCRRYAPQLGFWADERNRVSGQKTQWEDEETCTWSIDVLPKDADNMKKSQQVFLSKENVNESHTK